MVLDRLSVPIILAPMAGGPSTPELAAAVSNAGGLGFLAFGYLTADAAAEQLAATRALTDRPLGVNVFVPASGPSPQDAVGPYLARLRAWAEHRGVEIAAPRYADDDWGEKLALLGAEPPAVVSFTFGCPPTRDIARLRSAGSEVWVTITSVAEARTAAAAGADGLVVQGTEAGGHRGSFFDTPELEPLALLPLLELVRASTGLPLVASGGLATREAVDAVLRVGARAAQIGTAFLLAPEAATSAPHRAALRGEAPTVLTRAFTGRLARGIRNSFIVEHETAAPVAYPEIHYVTAPMRRAARASGDPDLINLWAGEAYPLAREEPAAEIVARLGGQAQPGDAPAAFDAHARRYDAERRRLIPPFGAFYDTAVEAVALAGTPSRVLDLGAGTGILARHVRAAFPHAEITLLDGSARMLEEARAALGDSGGVDLVEADLRDPLPPGPWDAVVSALAIHHLEHEEQQNLFARIHAALAPGGVFVDAEQVDGTSRALTTAYAAWQQRRARAAGSDDAEWAATEARMAFDRCASVETLMGWLRAAGYETVDCLFKQYRFAVLAAFTRS